MSFNLATILRESARRTPDSTVLRFGGSSLSYAELDELSSRCARGLRAQSLAPGDAVAVQLPNFPEFLVAYFGILKAGLVMVPLNPLLRAPEIAYHLGDSAAKLVICFVGFLDETVKVIGDLPLFVVPMPGSEPPEGLAAFAALLGEPRDPANDITPRHADDTAVIIYTSGTTGKPKGAELTHSSCTWGARWAGSCSRCGVTTASSRCCLSSTSSGWLRSSTSPCASARACRPWLGSSPARWSTPSNATGSRSSSGFPRCSRR